MSEIITNWYDVRNFLETKTLLIFGFLLLISITALFCSKAGIINLALEGQLISGVFGYVIFGMIAKKTITIQNFIYLNTFISILGSFLFVFLTTLIFSFLTISLKINQILVGIGINIVTGGIASFVTIILANDVAFTSKHFDTFFTFSSYESFMYQKFTNYFQLFLPILLLIFIIPFVWFFISKTTIGLRIKSVGIDPKVLKTIGISPEKYKYIAVLFGSFLMTIASWFFIEFNGKFSGSVSGFGYLGLSMMLLGKGKVFVISIFTLLIAMLSNFTSKIITIEPDPEIYITQAQKDEFRSYYSSLENLFNALVYVIPILIIVFYEIVKKINNNKSKLQIKYKELKIKKINKNEF